MMRRNLALLALLLVAAPSLGSEELFAKRVAPLLSRACVGCHDPAKKRGGLDLSTHAGLLAGGDSGAVVVPGKPKESALVLAVSGAKPRMPREGAKLTAAEVAVLEKWIAEGANWPADTALKATPKVDDGEGWWSLRPLIRPPVPSVKDAAWARTPIDRFIRAVHEKHGLRPAVEADRGTLVRRLSFDLLGLPPTPEEVEAFAADSAPDAYERLVDRLLSSPAYGERWGRHWLDVARYGDTHGYDKDKRRDHAWPYRDWVIRALDSDKPYRDFVREQLAGDVLAPGSVEGVAAVGFVVAGPWDFVGHVELREGTVDKEKTRLIDRDDMVTSAVGTFTSLTVGCARCHDHKFDPIDQRDYYRLQAVFAGVERGDRPVEDADLTKRRDDLIARRDEAKGRLTELSKRIASLTGPEVKRLDAELVKTRAALAALPLPKAAASPSNGYHSSIMPTPDHVKWVQVDLGSVQSLDEVRLIAARPTDFPDTPGFGFPVRYRVEVCDEPKFEKPAVLLDRTKADVENPKSAVVRVVAKGAKARYVRVTATRLWKRTNDYVFALAEAQIDSGGLEVARGKPVTSLDSIEAGRWSRKYLVDGHDSRQRLPDASDPESAKAYRQTSERIERLEGERIVAIEKAVPAETKAKRARLEVDLRTTETAIQKMTTNGPRIYSVRPIAPRAIHVLRRGDVEQKKAVVTPGALSCVEGPAFTLTKDDEGQRRLALANWIVDVRNAIAWRSIVNRVWHYHFGRGLVDTPNDFGKMGSLPTHPELLDWLADEFRTHGSLKRLHRLIVTSAVYRQASAHDVAAARIDSDNRYLWRMNRRRLDAESLRDAVLAVSGKLDRRGGGPGYDLFRFRDDHSPEYDHTDRARIHDPTTYRRTVYRFTVRSVPNPFLDSLDCADPNQPTPVRNTTLTALQALALMNNPFMVRQARHFADRLIAHSADPARQVEAAYRLAFGRPPTAEEGAAVVAYARKHGLAAACRVLFNANEFAFVD